MTVFLLAQAVDLATGDIQRSKQGGCAVALVIVSHRLATAVKGGVKPGQELDVKLLSILGRRSAGA
jgi:hypothetical protein